MGAWSYDYDYQRGYDVGYEDGKRVAADALRTKQHALQAKLKGLQDNAAKTEAELVAVNTALNVL